MKNENLIIRLTSQQKKEIAKLAKLSGLSMSQYVLDLINNSQDKTIHMLEKLDEKLDELLKKSKR